MQNIRCPYEAPKIAKSAKDRIPYKWLKIYLYTDTYHSYCINEIIIASQTSPGDIYAPLNNYSSQLPGLITVLTLKKFH